jgi:predicted aspartyl protease
MGRGGQATAVGGKFEKVYGLLTSCQIGEVRLDNVPVLVRPFSYDRNPVDGYIGVTFISEFVTSVDYGKQTLRLERPAKGERRDGAGGHEVPVKATSIGVLTREVRIEGIDGPLNFIVDTGASVSVLARTVETLPGISSCRRGGTLEVHGAAGIEGNVKTIFLPRFNVGPSQQEDILAAVLDLNLISEAAGSPQMGIVGGNFLRHFRVVFDLPQGVVRLVPLTEEPSKP